MLWDGGAIHGGPEVEHLLTRHPRLQVERFPAYAPELNPDELVWNYLKGELANGSPDTITDLLDEMTCVTRRLRCTPALLRAFIVGSELPFPFSA